MNIDMRFYQNKLRSIRASEEAAREAKEGRTRIRPEVKRIVKKFHELQKTILNEYGLSRRETDVALLLLSGIAYVHIAELLVVTQDTVRFHTHNILRKCSVKSRNDLSLLVFIKLHFLGDNTGSSKLPSAK